MRQRVSQALAAGARLLSETSPSARADAAVLLAHVAGRDRNWLLAHAESELDDAQTARYAALCAERATGKPVAYLTGTAGFYKRDFAVDERVLIPRPETEHLVEDAIEFLRARPAPFVLEAGVGSGAIACTLAAEVRSARVTGTDISVQALEVALQNARRLHVEDRCTFVQADVVPQHADAAYDLIIANLPYIPTGDVPEKPDPVGFEPRTALDGGADGLAQYRTLLRAAPRLIHSDGLLLLEAAPPTIPALATLVREAFPQAQVRIRRDYAGIERYVSACLQ